MSDKYDQLHGAGNENVETEPRSSTLINTASNSNHGKQNIKCNMEPDEPTSSGSERHQSRGFPPNFNVGAEKISPVKHRTGTGLLQRFPSVEDFNARFHGKDEENLSEILKHYGIDESNQEDRKKAGDDFQLPSFNKSPKNVDYTEHNERLTSFGITLTDRFSDIVLSHPCIVLRRQAQVNNVGKVYHLTPFTMITAGLRLQKMQGFTCLWKGLSSGLTCHAMCFGIESIVSETHPNFPREVSPHSTVKQMFGHLLLKAFSITITLPFYSAHIVETIQSDIASDTPGLFFCITEGFSRLFGYGGVQSQRLLPFRKLIIPTVSYILIKYTLTAILHHFILLIIRTYKKWKHEQIIKRLVPKSPISPSATNYEFLQPSQAELQHQLEESYLKSNFPELFAAYLAQMITDICMYPLETVVNKLHIQGTRTIIDDMDKGSGFLPVNTRYTGATDCFSTIRATEGVVGFYRGFGGLVLQQTLKFGVLKVLEIVLELMSSS